IRLFLLQAIEGIGHVRELMRQVQVNLAYRWFVGYELDEELPDHSTLSRTLDRLGEEIFDQVFGRSIEQCLKSGLISGKVLHVDATTIRADLDRNKVGGDNKRCDRDARYGKFPGNRRCPGYKQHTVADDGSRVVLGVSVTTADRHEHGEALPLLDDVLKRLASPPQSLCGDTAYASGFHYDEFVKRGIRLIAPPQVQKRKEGYFSVEEFAYDESRDLFVCPAGKELKYVGSAKGRDRRTYRALPRDCRHCPLKSRCTVSDKREINVSAHYGGLVKLRADSKTASFKAFYASRAPNIEGVFAEEKQWHSLGRAWRRGLSKMRVQCLLIAAVLNFKRLAAACRPFSTLLCLLRTLQAAIWRLHRAKTTPYRNLTQTQLQTS
ncbi:MAG: IS1182 family transposase, partial [bacterium]